MTSFVEIDRKKFQNVNEAAKLIGYSRDHVTKLAREKKIEATQIGRQWFVFLPSLETYAKRAEQEQVLRKQKLSAQRKKEREQAKRIADKERARLRAEQKKKFYVRVAATAAVVLGIGLGVFIDTHLISHVTEQQTASVQGVESVEKMAEEFLVATGDVVEPAPTAAIDFSQESVNISTIDGGQGVMLLPADSDKMLTEKEVQQLFSDPVTIVNGEDGNQYVVRTKSDGSEERLPFAVVPVANSQTP